MEPEGSLPHSQVPTTCPYPEPDLVHAPTSHFLNIHLNIISPSTLRSCKLSLSLRFPRQNPVWTYPLPHTCHMPRPSPFSWFDHPNNIWWAVQIIKLPLCSLLYSTVTSPPLGPNFFFLATKHTVHIPGNYNERNGFWWNMYLIWGTR